MAYTAELSETADISESSASPVNWGAVIAGAFAAATLTLILTLLGSGLGLSMVSPWSGEGAGLTTFAVTTAIWLIVVQWLSSAAGGYLTGRLRTKWVGVHTDETFFRDTAHGFLSWAVGTVLMALVLGSAASSLLNAGVQSASTVAAGALTGAGAGAAAASESQPVNNAASYFVDSLFRPTDPVRLSAPGTQGDAEAAAQATRILAQGAVDGALSDSDKAYLGQLVAARTGLSEADATARVNEVLARADEAKTKATEAADAARKASATFALFAALSLVIGAFISSAAAALGGRQRDEHEDLFIARLRR